MYLPKNSQVQGRQEKVQTLTVPVSIVGSATAANVSITVDEPSFVFFKTEGVDQITGQLASNETATYADSPSDSSGVFNVLINVSEAISKVCFASMYSRTSLTAQAAKLGSTTGITTGTDGGSKIMLTGDTSVALNAANTADLCLHVEYVVSE